MSILLPLVPSLLFLKSCSIFRRKCCTTINVQHVLCDTWIFISIHLPSVVKHSERKNSSFPLFFASEESLCSASTSLAFTPWQFLLAFCKTPTAAQRSELENRPLCGSERAREWDYFLLVIADGASEQVVLAFLHRHPEEAKAVSI